MEVIGGIISVLMVIFLAIPIYLLPSIVAFFRNHHQKYAILLLNLFLGWTILGWIAAAVWAATAVFNRQTADVQPNQVTVITQLDDKTWTIILHLSQLCGFLVPLAGLIVPIVIWQMKKNESALIDQHGRIIANWMITAFFAGIVFFMLSFVLIGIPLLIILGVLCVIFPIIGAIKAKEGTVWPYPGSYRFFPVD